MTTHIASEKKVYNLKRNNGNLQWNWNKKLRTTTDNNGVKNKTKNDKVFSNYKTDNIAEVEVVNTKIQRKKSYAEILKTDRNTAGKLVQNRNEEVVDIVAKKEIEIAKPKIVDSCELGDTNNMSSTSEIARDYKRGNLKAVLLLHSS